MNRYDLICDDCGATVGGIVTPSPVETYRPEDIDRMAARILEAHECPADKRVTP